MNFLLFHIYLKDILNIMATQNKQLYLYQLDSNLYSYNYYNSCIVCAYSEQVAKNIDPEGGKFQGDSRIYKTGPLAIDEIQCHLIGAAAPFVVRGLILELYIQG